MRFHLDLGANETLDTRAAATDLLLQGARQNDELETYFAGERTAFPAGRLADLAPDAPIARVRIFREEGMLRYHRCCALI